MTIRPRMSIRWSPSQVQSDGTSEEVMFSRWKLPVRNGAMTMISIGTMVKTATANPSRALAFRPLEAMRARPPNMTRLRIRFRVSGSMAAIAGKSPPR